MEIGTYLVKGSGSTEERLKVIRDAGFDFVCLGKGMFDGTSATPQMCERVGIKFDNIHLSGGGTTKIWSPGEEGEAIADRYCNEIRMATEFGVHTGIVHVTWGTTTIPHEPDETGMARFTRIYECAEKYGFCVAIENSVFPKHIYKVLDSFPSPTFGHCYDSGHKNAFLPNEDFLGKYGDRLVATHLHDNDAKHDLHIMPFDGTIDWKKLAAQFAKTELARKRITSEFGGAGVRELKGMSAEEIEKDLSALAIYGTNNIKIGEGYAEFYAAIPYEELISQLYERMSKLKNLIEAAYNNSTSI